MSIIRKKQITIIGGGAAGFFLACLLDSSKYQVRILEKTGQVLSKVRISGGGRCNVTNGLTDPALLAQNYPRGGKELRALFHAFGSGEMQQWLRSHGVEVKTEADGRVFPVSDSSASIISCFTEEASRRGTQVHLNTGVREIQPKSDGSFEVITSGKSESDSFHSDIVVATTGSASAFWSIVEKLGHSIISPVPSLFTFNIDHPLLKSLPGTSFPRAELKIEGIKKPNAGPLMITHWGLGGPAVLVLSAREARTLAEMDYHFGLSVNFMGQKTAEVEEMVYGIKRLSGRELLRNARPELLSKKFWQYFLDNLSFPEGLRWADVKKSQIQDITAALTGMEFQVTGKSTHKDEFVTAGGVSRKEIHWKTMESRIIPNLYLAGEVIDVDAVTGGFNFQACWSEAWAIAAHLNQA